MEISHEGHEGNLTVFLKGRLDGNGAGELDTRMGQFIAKIDTKLILDYDQVSYISSSGLRIMVKYAKQLRLAGKDFELINMNTDVYKVFKLSGFTGIMKIGRKYAD